MYEVELLEKRLVLFRVQSVLLGHKENKVIKEYKEMTDLMGLQLP
jgi:hypothetical protein